MNLGLELVLVLALSPWLGTGILIQFGSASVQLCLTWTLIEGPRAQ